jgi:hypothetical protein
MSKTDFKSGDEYIATQPEDVQAILQRVRGTGPRDNNTENSNRKQ